MRAGVCPSLWRPGAPADGVLLDGLVHAFAHIPRSVWLERFRQGDVFDEQGRALTPDTPLSPRLQVYYYKDCGEEMRIPFEATILFEDAHLLVADKPPFLPVTPGGRYVRECLLSRLRQQTGNAALTPLHRLDRETRGLVLFAKQACTRAAYQGLFRDQSIHKTYLAYAPALPTVHFPLDYCSRLEEDPERFFVMRTVPGSPNSATHIECLRQEGAFWLYRLTPQSGRKHQLRAHMNALGAPILHDRFYPEPHSMAEDDFTRPLALLAQCLHFHDPISGALRSFQSTQDLQLEALPEPAFGKN